MKKRGKKKTDSFKGKRRSLRIGQHQSAWVVHTEQGKKGNVEKGQGNHFLGTQRRGSLQKSRDVGGKRGKGGIATEEAQKGASRKDTRS